MTSPTPAQSPLAAAFEEAKHRFPLWFSVWMCLGHVCAALLLVKPPHFPALLTVLLPLSWVVACYALLAPEQRPTRAVLGIMSVAAPAITILSWLPVYLLHDRSLAAMHLGVELLSFIWVIVLAAHCHRDRGWTGILVFFGLGALCGFLLENSGIEMGFYVEPSYWFYVPGSHTPISAVAGWCTIFYPSVYIADLITQRLRLRSKVVVPALIVSLAALSSDLHFDPIATALGMWVWNSKLTAAWLDVPLVNFTSWFSALFAVAGAYYWVSTRSLAPRVKLIVALLSIPVALATSAVLNFTIIGVLEGFDGPSWQIVRLAISTQLLH